MDIETIKYWKWVVEILDKGGMTKNLLVFKACKKFWEHGYSRTLQRLLERKPGLLRIAWRNVQEQKDYPFWPPPLKQYELEKIKGKYPFGIVNNNGDIIGFDPLNFTRGLFVCGEPGSGKSYPILIMLDHILSIPKEVRGFNVLVIQLLKHDADFLIRKHPKFLIIEEENLRWNMFECEPWDDPEKNVKSAASIFASTNYLMSLTRPILKESIKLCRKKGNPLNFTNIKAEIDNAKKSLGLEGFESKAHTDKVKSRIHEFLENPQLNVERGFPVEGFWSKEDICLNFCDEHDKYIRSTVVTDILISLQRYYERFPVRPERLRTLVIIDECRSVFPRVSDNNDFDADEFLEKFVTTRRSSGIGLITLTQEPQSVSVWLAGNSAFFLTFPIAGRALEDIKVYQNLSDEQISFIPKLPPYGTGILRDRRFDRPYLVTIPGGFEIESIPKEEVDDFMWEDIKGLHESLSKPSKRDLEKEKIQIRKDGKWLKTMSDGIRILETLINDPFMHKTALRDRLDLGTRIDPAIDWLKGNGFISENKFKHSNQGKTYAKYLPLTEKGQDTVQIPVSKRIAQERFEHTLFIKHVAGWIEGQGYEPIKEYSVRGIEKRIDVFAVQDGLRTAYEISLTINSRDVLKNVYKCFRTYNVDKLYIVCDTQQKADDVQKRIVPEIQVDWISKIKFTWIGDFL